MRVGVGAASIGVAAADEQLLDDRLDGDRARRRAAVVGRHVAPAEQRAALPRATIRSNSRLDRAPRAPRRAAGTRGRRRTAPAGGSAMPRRAASLRKNRSGIWMRMPAPSPVFASQPQAPRCSQVDEDLQRLPDDRVRAPALDVDDEADAAGVVLVARVVEAVGRKVAVRCGTRIYVPQRARRKTDSTHRIHAFCLWMRYAYRAWAAIVRRASWPAGLDTPWARPCYVVPVHGAPPHPLLSPLRLRRARVVARVRCRRPAGEKPRTASSLLAAASFPLSSRRFHRNKLIRFCCPARASALPAGARPRPSEGPRRSAEICRAHGNRMLTSTIVELDRPNCGAACRAAAGPPARARGREHPHHPRGGRRVRAAGDALFDRQGLVGAAAPGAEGVLSRADSVPAAAHRHHLQVPRDDRVPRLVRRARSAPG